ncbi:MAG: phosphatidate cytidylyltransferase [Anaerovoracaceae bacterium]|jgi:phosphatidate cytidylyltransferase
MKTRILSGLIMAPMLIFLYFGGRLLLIACFLVALAGIREFYNGFEKMDVKPLAGAGYLAVFGLYFIGLWTLYPSVTERGEAATWYLAWFFAATLISMLYLFAIEKRAIEDGMATLTGIFYVAFLSYHVVLVERGFGTAVWFVVLTAFGTDIFAYFTGVLIGKHKLCPKISPKKTKEGALGGVAGSMVLCGLFGFYFMGFGLAASLILGLVGSIFAQLGDLTASIFKRHMDIKDFGNLIPGHGGILDRFDSILFTAPTVYYLLLILNGVGFISLP